MKEDAEHEYEYNRKRYTKSGIYDIPHLIRAPISYTALEINTILYYWAAENKFSRGKEIWKRRRY